MSLRTRRGGALLASFLFAAAACTPSGNTASPTGGGAQSPGTSPGATATTGGGAEQTLTYAIDGEISQLNNALSDVPTSEAAGWLHAQVYRYNDQLEPVPDLATDLAEISEDGLTWTVTLRDNAFFSDGTNVTAEDVEFTYQLADSENCRFNPSVCLQDFLESVEATDERTVVFTLTQKYAPFATVNLPGIFIDSKAAIEASFQEFESKASAVDAAEVKALDDRIKAEQAKDPPGALAPMRAEIETILNAAGITLPNEADYTTEGTLDEEGYVGAEALLIDSLNISLTAEEIDAIAAVYPLLSGARAPVGAGPFKLDEFKPGQSLTYSANEQYHFGKPQISRMFLPIIKDEVAAGSALKAGQIDWKYSISGDVYGTLENDPNLKFAEYPDFGYFGLQYNLREGRLFADKNLRQAVAYCIDKPQTVAAATDNQGVPIYSETPPASWAYNPDVPKFEKDVAKGKQLIESSGWTLGSDGVYEKGGEKLSTNVLVRAGRPDRIKFMQLLKEQVKECGIDITVQEADFGTVLTPMIDNYPHIPPGATEPFDAYFGGWSTSLDPDPYSIWHSSQATGPQEDGSIQNETYNYIGFNNPRVDELIEQGLEELDQAKRTEIYKEFQTILADEQPYLFAWSDIAREGLRKTVGGDAWTTDNMGTPTWFWEIEKITNVK
jgi:ABC-type transport system substrate-binding protein